MNAQSFENPFALPFRISAAILVLVTGAFLSTMVPPWMVIAPIAGAALIAVLFKHPTSILGLFLAWMPFEFLAVMSGRFFGLPLVDVVSKSKEPLLLLLILILWQRNGFRLAMPDWFLLGLVSIAVIYQAFGGEVSSFQDDFVFVLPYFAGRVAVLTAKQEHLWAKCAAWIVALLSVLGMLELFMIGDRPRTLLYLALGRVIEIEQGGLTGSFHGTGYAGLREASTMIGPPEFGALCMSALIIWWVYHRNPITGSMIAAGLVCAVTRSAWLGTAFAVSLLAFATKQVKRLVLYTFLVLGLFAAAIPVLGLSDYLFFTKTGQDPSAEWHRETILTGIQYVAEHPLGTGSGSIGGRALDRYRTALVIETSYLSFGGQYGIAALLCFVAFLLSAFRLLLRAQSSLGYAAAGIMVGFGAMMFVLIMHIDFRLNCWVWFPIGLAVRSAQSAPGPDCNADEVRRWRVREPGR